MAKRFKSKINSIFRKPLSKWQIKVFLAVIALVISLAVIFFTQLLVNALIEREQKIITFYTKAYENILNNALRTNTNVEDYLDLIEQITPSISFPLIMTDENDKPIIPFEDYSLNIEIDTSLSIEEQMAYMQSYVNEMKSSYEPIVLATEDETGQMRILNKFYYTDSPLIQTLRYFPFVAILAIAGFVFIGYLAFSSIRRNEQSKIWVGMSKEAAHQLGTPLSSILAWIEILKFNSDDPQAIQETLGEMEKDIHRLNAIATRFSKIGSKPELYPSNIYDIIEKASIYFEKRLPHLGRKVDINVDIDKRIITNVNPELFSWVIENLIKNAAEAIEDKEGHINIYSKNVDKRLTIYVRDSGKGMNAKQRRQAFNPGYTTKKRGWGLGLSLCKRIIENYHNGKIWIKDTTPGRGTTFAVEIPLTVPISSHS